MPLKKSANKNAQPEKSVRTATANTKVSKTSTGQYITVLANLFHLTLL